MNKSKPFYRDGKYLLWRYFSRLSNRNHKIPRIFKISFCFSNIFDSIMEIWREMLSPTIKDQRKHWHKLFWQFTFLYFQEFPLRSLLSWISFSSWCFWTVVLEKTLESPLDCKEIQPVHPKRNQPWIFIGRTDAEAESPILWPPDSKNWLIWKDSDAGKDWRQEEKGTIEDEMVGWHHQLNGHEFE